MVQDRKEEMWIPMWFKHFTTDKDDPYPVKVFLNHYGYKMFKLIPGYDYNSAPPVEVK